MIELSKLLCRNALSIAYCPCRYQSGSIKSAGGKWAELQEAREGEYFHKKNQEYLEYIRQELKKGRTIDDVIQEHKRHLEEERRKKEAATRNPDEEHLILTNDKEYVNYIKYQVKMGKPLEQAIREAKEALERGKRLK